MRRLVFLTLLVFMACTDSQNESIEVPFALLSSDELAAPTVGTPCTYSPVTSSAGFYRVNGFVELDPNINPTPGYLLALQVENYLSNVALTDSNGNTVLGGQLDDFLVTDAIVNYIPQQTYMAPNLSPGDPDHTAKFLTSGRVQAGGEQDAVAVLIQTLSPNAINDLTANLQQLASSQNITNPGGDIVLQIQLEGSLASGEPMISGYLEFPLHVCIDCYGPAPADCVDGVTLAPDGHGPCCAPQDFSATCVGCGGAGQPCCAEPDNGVPFTCGQDSDCFAFGFGLPILAGGVPTTPGDCLIGSGGPPGTCICQGNSDCTTFYGASSTCNQGVCTPGCNSDPTGKPLVCQSATLAQGTEDCNYPGSLAVTNACGTGS
jgi:hypothetical protein